MVGASPLTVVIPSRGRPQHVARTAEAWRATGAMDAGVPVVYGLDALDPHRTAYHDQIREHFGPLGVWLESATDKGMVPTINMVGRHLMYDNSYRDARPWAVAVLNDDHLPRTQGWHATMVGALEAMGTGIVYGDDLLRGESLCTAWAMTADIVVATNRIVPCLVTHLYADNAVMDLGRAAAVLRYLPGVVIEHLHYTAGKSEKDEHYARVNSSQRWDEDSARYGRWQVSTKFADQVEAVKALRLRHLGIES